MSSSTNLKFINQQAITNKIQRSINNKMKPTREKELNWKWNGDGNEMERHNGNGMEMRWNGRNDHFRPPYRSNGSETCIEWFCNADQIVLQRGSMEMEWK